MHHSNLAWIYYAQNCREASCCHIFIWSWNCRLGCSQGRDSRSKRTFLSWYLSLPPPATTWLKIKHLFLTEPRWGTNSSFKMRMVLNVSTWFKLNWTLTFWRNKHFSLWRCSWEFASVWNHVHCYSPPIQVTGI